MKPLIALALISAFAVGCQAPVDEDKLIELEDFNLSVQEDWDVFFYTSNQAKIKTPDPNNMDYLILDVRQDDSINLTDWEIVGSNGSTIVYDNSCGGVFDCFYFQFEDSLYEITFAISSSEEQPGFMDGIWVPQVDVETYEMIDLLLTATPSQD